MCVVVVVVVVVAAAAAASTPPLSLKVLQTGCSSCCPNNSVKALKAKCSVNENIKIM